jgi:hypothetical protein
MGVDQSDCITRRPADRQYPLGEGARSDLQSVTAVALSIAGQLSKTGWSWAVLQLTRTWFRPVSDPMPSIMTQLGELDQCSLTPHCSG